MSSVEERVDFLEGLAAIIVVALFAVTLVLSYTLAGYKDHMAGCFQSHHNIPAISKCVEKP